MPSLRHGFGATVAGLALMFVALPALAQVRPHEDPQRASCIAASEEGQASRQSGKLRAARTAFLACSKPECPQTVKLDCDGWLDEVNKSLPTVVVQVVGPHGEDVTNARISFDQELIAERLTGAAVAVDPGDHTFHAVLADGKTADQRVTIREADKARTVVVRFPLAPTVPGPPPDPAIVSVKETRRPTAANLVVGSALGIAGLAALGAAIYFETQQASLASTLQAECQRPCPATPQLQSQVNSGKTDQLLEGVFFSLSALAVGGSVYVIVAKPFRAPVPTTSAFELVPSLHGATAVFRLAF